MCGSITLDFPEEPDPRKQFSVLAKKLDELIACVKQSQDDQNDREWYSVEEAAHQLGLAVWTVRNYCRTKRIRGDKLANGREWRISKQEIRRYKEQGPPPEYHFPD